MRFARRCMGYSVLFSLLTICTPTIAFGQAPYVWGRLLGGAHDDGARGMAMDGDGDVFVTGLFETSSVEFGGSTFNAANGPIYLVKYEGIDGSHVWSMQTGTEFLSTPEDIAADSDGNIVMVGHFNGSNISFGGSGLTSNGSDVFVAKYSGANGSHIWSKKIGGSGSDRGFSVAVDADDDVFLTGRIGGSVIFEGDTLSYADDNDIFLIKLAGSDGARLWSESFGGTDPDVGNGVAVNGDDDVLIIGDFSGTVNMGGSNLVSGGLLDIFLAKFDGSNGDHIWSLSFGNTANDHGVALAVGVDNKVSITGQFDGTVNFGGGDLESEGNGDIVVAQFTSAGSHRWSRSFGQPNSPGGGVLEQGTAISIVETGATVVAGEFESTVDFGGGPLTESRHSSGGEADMFVASYDSLGRHLWSTSIGGNKLACGGNDDGWQKADELLAVANGDIMIAGRIETPTDFGAGLVTPHGTGCDGRDDGYILKYTVPVVTVADADLLVCPGGDADSLIISLDFNDDAMPEDVLADSITVETPVGGNVTMFGTGPIHANDDANSGNDYETTISVRYLGGCSEGSDASFPIRVNGRLVGTAFAQIKSPDMNGGGWVDTVGADYGQFSASYSKCVGNVGYDACADFLITGSPSCVGLSDLSYYAVHKGDNAPGGPLFAVSLPFEALLPLSWGGSASLRPDPADETATIVTIHDVDQIRGGVVHIDIGDSHEYVGWDLGSDPSVASAARLDGTTLAILFLSSNATSINGESVELGSIRFQRTAAMTSGAGSDELRFVSGTLRTVSGKRLSLTGGSREAGENGSNGPNYADGLTQNAPNPFNPSTVIPYSVARRGSVVLAVYSVTGELVRELVNEAVAAGEYRVSWDGKDAGGNVVASGTYFCKLNTQDSSLTRKLVLLK